MTEPKRLSSEELNQWHKDNGLRVKPIMDHISALTSENERLAKSWGRLRKEIAEIVVERDSARAEAARYRDALESVYRRIEHGDAEHRAWLKRELDQIVAEVDGTLSWEPSTALKEGT